MSSNIKLFCDNIFNYDYLKNIRTDKKILIKFAINAFPKKPLHPVTRIDLFAKN